MMHISRVELSGLWGCKSYNINLNHDFNFFIGPNGSGKTTILTLIASIINLDLNSINKIDFYECTLDLVSEEQAYKLSVLKGEDSNGDNVVNYIIDDAFTDENVISDFFRSRRIPGNGSNNDYFRLKRQSSNHTASEKLMSFLNKNIKMTWLPIGRANLLNNFDDHKFDNSVDIRLEYVADSFVKYVSYINQTISERMNEFQKDVFLSVIDFSFFDQIKNKPTNLDIQKEKDVLIEAFREVGIREGLYQKKINKMFNVIKAVEERNSKTRNPDLSFEEIIWIFNTWKAHYLVEKYNEYKLEKNKINTSVDSFIKILNDLFEGRKTFFVSKSNELCAYSSDGYEIKLSDLSSGEKQLLIILSEALLQNGKRCLYLADEPELSLHVSWQEKIVNSIFEINKNVQIIFATHSPDVVSWRQDKTIFMSGE